MTEFLRRLAYHVCHEKAPLRWLVSRFIHRTGIGSFLTVDRGLFLIRLFPTNYSLMIQDEPNWGKADERFLRSYLRPGDLVVDVGANVGFISLAAASLVGPSGKVFSIEAHPRTFQYLKANANLNGFSNLTLLNYALGNKIGTVTISNKKMDDMNRVDDKGGTSVPLTTLDEVLSVTQGRIRLLKIDVEGYEKFVFEGAFQSLSRTDCIYFEVCEEHFATFDYSTADLLNFLGGTDFSSIGLMMLEKEDLSLSTSFLVSV